MKSILLIIALFCGFFAGISETSAQVWRRREPAPLFVDSTKSEKQFLGSVVYLEGASAWFSGALFANFEYVFHENWSARVGGGGGYVENIANGLGGLIGVTYFSGNDHKFEAGAGMCFAGIVEYGRDGEKTKQDWAPYPAFWGGYRYQPAGVGMFFRAGVSYYSFGGGAHLAVGFRL